MVVKNTSCVVHTSQRQFPGFDGYMWLFFFLWLWKNIFESYFFFKLPNEVLKWSCHLQPSGSLLFREPLLVSSFSSSSSSQPPFSSYPVHIPFFVQNLHFWRFFFFILAPTISIYMLITLSAQEHKWNAWCLLSFFDGYSLRNQSLHFQRKIINWLSSNLIWWVIYILEWVFS